MTKRRIMMAGLAAGAASLLSSCGTIIYPDRANQKERGDLDALILGLDAVGLLFFLIPGIIAFAVDFGTGAIYFPEDHEKGDREHTNFDKMDSEVRLDKQEIEKIVAVKTGKHINLETNDVRVMELQGLDQFWRTYTQLSNRPMLAAR
jgi:hypothetical protein